MNPRNQDSEHQLSVPSVGPEDAIRRAAAEIDRARLGITTVVDARGRLIGTITDGDIRRAMLDGVDLEAPTSALLARKSAAYARPTTAPVDTDPRDLLTLMREHSVRQIPLLDAGGCPVRVVLMEDLLDAESGTPPTDLHAVVMAGGLGTRLRPLTANVPKPMLDVAGRPLLEHTVDRLRDAGVRSISISTNYLAEQIEGHFGDGSSHGVSIGYVQESQPLGTAGALALLDPRPTEPFLVLNGDILTGIDFRAMRAFHEEHDSAITMAVRRHQIAVPFGVAECDGVVVRTLAEKPNYPVLVNAGMYLLEPRLLDLITPNVRMDMTELIEKATEAGERVTAFAVHEYWLDIGRPDDYERAQAEASAVIGTTQQARNKRIAS